MWFFLKLKNVEEEQLYTKKMWFSMVLIFLQHFAFPYLKVRNGVGLSTFFWAVATPVSASLSHPISSETVKCYKSNHISCTQGVTMFQIPSYTLIYHHIPSYTLIYPHIPSYTLIYPHIPSYTLICTSHTLIYHHILSYTICCQKVGTGTKCRA